MRDAQTMGPPHGGVWRLDVLDGPNAGASLTLHPGVWRLGGGEEDDILLADPDAAPGHAVIELGADRALLRAAANLSAGGRRLAPGQGRRLGDAAEIRLGATRLRLSRGFPPSAPRRRATPALAGFAAVALPCALLFGLPSGGHHADGAATPGEAPRSAAPAARPDAGAARDALAVRVAEAGLAGRLELRAEDHAVLVTGSLTAEEMSRWRVLQAWYDARFGAGPALLGAPRLAAAAPEAERPPLALRAVSFGEVPFVIGADGERYGEGAVFAGGWTLESIGRERLIFRRGERVVALTH